MAAKEEPRGDGLFKAIGWFRGVEETNVEKASCHNHDIPPRVRRLTSAVRLFIIKP
jgi:hypothetical protein